MNKLSKFKIIEEAFLLIDKNGWEDFSLEKLALINKLAQTYFLEK